MVKGPQERQFAHAMGQPCSAMHERGLHSDQRSEDGFPL